MQDGNYFDYLYKEAEGGIPKNLVYGPVNDQGIPVISWLTPSIDFEKTASAGLKDYHPNVQEYVGALKPRAGWVACVISALGSYEAYGFNKNGDGFPRAAFTDDNVHKTYEEFGHPFKHHVNKIEKGHPVYGDKVSLAEFNESMDRVELVVWYDLARDTTLMADIDNGNAGVSMGFKAKFDTCNICNRHAKRLVDYCEHAIGSVIGQIPAAKLGEVKSSPHPVYRLGYVFPDGRKVGRYNRYGRFFDISRVIIPAWRPGRILEKVAYERNVVAQVPSNYDTIPSGLIYLEDNLPKVAHNQEELAKVSSMKKTSEEKTADIIKKVPTMDDERKDRIVELANHCEQVKQVEPEMPRTLLNNVAKKHELSSILSSMLSLGIMPKPKEFQRIVLVKIGKERLADELDKLGMDFTCVPANLEIDAEPVCFDETDINDDLIDKLASYIPERSCFAPFLHERLEKIAADPRGYGAVPERQRAVQGEDAKDPTRTVVPTLGTLAGLYLFLKGGIMGAKPMQHRGEAIMGKDEVLEGVEKAIRNRVMPDGKVGGKFSKFVAKALDAKPKTKLALATAGGISLTGLLAGLHHMSKPRPQGNIDIPMETEYEAPVDHTNYMTAIMQKNRKPFEKIGSLNKTAAATKMMKTLIGTGAGATAARIAVGLPAMYMASGVMRVRKQKNPYEPESRISSFVRKNPGLSAGLVAFGPHGAKMAYKELKHQTKGLFKGAQQVGVPATPKPPKSSVWKTVRDMAIWGAVMPKRVASNVASGVVDGLLMSGIEKAVSAIGKKKNKTNKIPGGNYGNISRTM